MIHLLTLINVILAEDFSCTLPGRNLRVYAALDIGDIVVDCCHHLLNGSKISDQALGLVLEAVYISQHRIELLKGVCEL